MEQLDDHSGSKALNDETLDGLLSTARWDDAPDAARSDVACWRSAFARKPMSWPWAVCAAAAVVLVSSMAIWSFAPRARPARAVSVPHVQAIASTAEPLVRPANMYERLLMLQASPKRRLQAATAPALAFGAARQPGRPTPVYASAASLEAAAYGNSPAARKAAFACMLESDRPQDLRLFLTCVTQPRLRNEALAVLQALPYPPTAQLIAEFDSPLVVQRLAAARALSCIDQPKLTALLFQMMHDNDHRREAMAALLGSNQPQACLALSQATRAGLIFPTEVDAVRADLHQLF